MKQVLAAPLKRNLGFSLFLLISQAIAAQNAESASLIWDPFNLVNRAPIGSLDQVSKSGEIRGWALDPNTVLTPDKIQIYIDGLPGKGGTLLGTIATDIARKDVSAYTGSPIPQGFKFQIPLAYFDGASHSIYAFALDTTGGSSTLLPGSPKSFQVSNHLPAGYIDKVDETYVYGWASDADTPNLPIAVQFYIDAPKDKGGKFIGSIPASLRRADVGEHGFRFKIPPAAKDGQLHALYAYGADNLGANSPPLGNSPKAIVPLGINLTILGSSDRQLMLVDAMKTARSFGSVDNPWGYQSTAPLDQDGWPTDDFGSMIIDPMPGIDGIYTLVYDGEGTIDGNACHIEILSQDYDAEKNRTTIRFKLFSASDPSQTQLVLKFFTNHKGARNIHIYRPGYDANTTEIFYQPFLDRLKPFGVIRLMEYQHINSSPLMNWEDRPKLTDALYSSTMKQINFRGNLFTYHDDSDGQDHTVDAPKGGPIELAILLANQTGKDLWVNIPDMASDDFIQKLAELLKSELKPEISVYLEYSNEVGVNIPSFYQSGRCSDKAEDEIKKGDTTYLSDEVAGRYGWGGRYAMKRMVQAIQIFKRVFGEDQMFTRVRPILGTQAGSDWLINAQLTYVKENFGAPSKWFYALSIFAYSTVWAPVDHATDNDVLDSMQKSMNQMMEITIRDYNIAKSWGLKYMAYEGGAPMEDPHSWDVKLRMNQDPRFLAQLRRFFQRYYSCTHGLFMYFYLAGAYSAEGFANGAYGLTDNIQNSTPKLDSVGAILNEPYSSFNQCF